MQFTEDKAREIAAQFGLSETTIKVWRSRGAIPDKYDDPNFEPRKQLDKAGSIRHDRTIDFIQSGKINLEVFATLCNVPAHRIRQAYPASSPRVLLSEQDLAACIVELQKLKIEIAKTFEKFSPLLLKRMLNNPVINYSVVVADKTLAHRISYVRVKKAEPDKQLWSDIKDKYAIFAMQIQK